MNERPHINADGQFQSDKYPTCPPGKVPLSVKDPTAQDLLWQYAQRRRSVDAEFADDDTADSEPVSGIIRICPEYTNFSLGNAFTRISTSTLMPLRAATSFSVSPKETMTKLGGAAFAI